MSSTRSVDKEKANADTRDRRRLPSPSHPSMYMTYLQSSREFSGCRSAMLSHVFPLAQRACRASYSSSDLSRAGDEGRRRSSGLYNKCLDLLQQLSSVNSSHSSSSALCFFTSPVVFTSRENFDSSAGAEDPISRSCPSEVDAKGQLKDMPLLSLRTGTDTTTKPTKLRNTRPTYNLMQGTPLSRTAPVLLRLGALSGSRSDEGEMLTFPYSRDGLSSPAISDLLMEQDVSRTARDDTALRIPSSDMLQFSSIRNASITESESSS
ncbi:hypothetical protein Mapa_007423 [Marchantia paleacea]|nr:hypothetical protein Mapa_007423 [Marchantia paleacea]